MQVRGLRNRDPVPEVSAFVEAYKIYLLSVFRESSLYVA